MNRLTTAIMLLVCSGCSTTPQADFCDFFFRSRNACATPQPATAAVIPAPAVAVGPPVAAAPVVPGPAVAVPAPTTVMSPAAAQPSCNCAQDPQKKDCAICRPFRALRERFRRN